MITPADVVRAYRRDRAAWFEMTVEPRPSFMRAWLRSWVIAARTTTVNEAKGKGYIWGERERVRMRGD